MSADNHHYECEVDGWRWVYEIDGGKLIADGKNGVEFQHFVVIGGIVVFVVLEVIIGPYVLSKLLYQRKVQRYVTFKRLSDGTGQFTLHSSFNEDDQAFEDFVNELFVVIQRQRTTQTPPDYSFKQ